MRIIVAGDSWACGEWGGWDTEQGYRVLDAGVSERLREQGHSVELVAQGGSTNLAQIAAVRREARAGDCVVFVQTDPLRDRGEIPGDLATYRSERRGRMAALYRALAGLPCSVLLVGGNTAVEADLIDPESPVRVAVADWVAELGLTRPTPHLCRAWRYPDCEPPLLELWEGDERRLRLWDQRCRAPGTAEHEWFWPDGRHPNRRAHEWLARERILPLLARLREGA